jgi:tellurite resistance protein TerC
MKNFFNTNPEWVVFFIVFAAAIVIDLLSSRGKEPSLRTAIRQTAAYLALGLVFGGYVFFTRGMADAATYWTGFIVEKSLSVDNIFVMGVIFSALGIPARSQRNLLYLGILGALVLRGICLGVGTIIAQFHWVLYGLGGTLIYLGWKILSAEEGEEDTPWALKKVQQWGLSPFAAALVAIEVTDVIFAIDSIPAILAISQDMFLVFTSNMFALLSLRSLYFCLQAVQTSYQYLPKALGGILIFIGIKALLPLIGLHIPTAISLVIVIGTIMTAILLSPKEK